MPTRPHTTGTAHLPLKCHGHGMPALPYYITDTTCLSTIPRTRHARLTNNTPLPRPGSGDVPRARPRCCRARRRRARRSDGVYSRRRDSAPCTSRASDRRTAGTAAAAWWRATSDGPVGTAVTGAGGGGGCHRWGVRGSYVSLHQIYLERWNVGSQGPTFHLPTPSGLLEPTELQQAGWISVSWEI